MITIDNTLFKDFDLNIHSRFMGKLSESLYSALYDSIFFDIETTGLSARNSMCYLIGVAYLEDNQWCYTQWFADRPEHERDIINAFFEKIKQYKYLVHFNGDSFDIPFLEQRCRLMELPYSFKSEPNASIVSIDLFKRIRRLSVLLQLDNYRQKSIEQFLNIYRDDKYSGGELIDFYKKYVIQKDNETKDLLLLHNHDDIAGLVNILPILSYEEYLSCNLECINSCELNETADFDGNPIKELLISAKLPVTVPVRLTLNQEPYYIIISDSSVKMRVKIFNTELKYFYPNYKDYYYLPDEDTAIYKSVASYVDKSHRIQAKADTCYVRKNGEFIPQPESVITPAFKESHKASNSYFEVSLDFLNDTDKQLQYVRAVIFGTVSS